LATGLASQDVNLLLPGTIYGDRVNNVDMRFAKVLRFGTMRTSINFDLANILNANYTQAITQAYGPRWQYPVSIMDGRLFRFGAQFDF
jgi:hypothetical protein